MDADRSERVRSVEYLPSSRQFRWESLKELLQISGTDGLCLVLLHEGLKKFLPGGVDLESLVERAEFSLIDYHDVSGDDAALVGKRVESIFKSMAEGNLEAGALTSVLKTVQTITKPLKQPCQSMNHSDPFSDASLVIDLGRPLFQETDQSKPKPCITPSMLLPLIEHLSIKPCISMLEADESTKALYPTFINALELFLQRWPAVNRYLDPYIVICEGPTVQQITNAINRLAPLPGGVQPTLINDPRGFQSNSILGGFTTRADADTTAIALRMIFKLPAPAVAGGATGGPNGGNSPQATIWVASTAAGMTVY